VFKSTVLNLRLLLVSDIFSVGPNNTELERKKMLVLSRKQGESVEFAELDVVVRVISLKKSKVQLGIEAPRHITVSRSEIAGERSTSPAVHASGTDQHSQVRILEELARVEAELAALAELAAAKDRVIARNLAADSIERLAGIKRTLRLSMHQRSEARPISDFIKVRADVIEQLRDMPQQDQDRADPDCEQSIAWPSSNPDRASSAREWQSGYSINSLQTANECSVA